MRKKIGYIALSIGVLFVVSYIVINNIHSHSETEKNEDSKIIIDTSKMTGDEIEEADNYSNYANSDLTETYIKDENLARKNKYTFYYPEDLIQYFLGDYNRILENGRMKLRAEIISGKSIEEYKEIELNDYSEYEKVRTYYSEEDIEISGYRAEYFKIEAFDSYNEEAQTEIYAETFAIIIKVTSEEYIAINYYIDFYQLSDEFLSDIVNKIKIDKADSSLYLYSTEENDFLVGTLKQNLIRESEHGYTLAYRIPSDKYEEQEDNRNTIYTTTFTKKEDKDTNINISIVYEDTDEIIEVLESYLNFDYISNYTVNDYKKEEIEINDETYTKISFSYILEENSQEKYYSMYVYKIKDDFVYTITIESATDESDEIVKDFTNYTIEEY